MKTTFYKIIPRRLMSKAMHRLSQIESPALKNRIISLYIRSTGANTTFAAEKDPYAYANLRAFFTRSLAEGARPIDLDPLHITSPVDGRCAIYGTLEADTLLQAKGLPYSAAQLLGSEDWAKHFYGGSAATLYLAPDDYHRVHTPCDAVLTAMRFCPGDRHSVALPLLNKIPNIFAGNERVVCLFNTPFGRMALVMIGALNVSSISTVWHGKVLKSLDNTYHYPDMMHQFNKGEEVGHFDLGSTVILLFEKNRVAWSDKALSDAVKIRVGEMIAKGVTDA